MRSPKLNNPLLRRYWFETREHLGIGVTAYSLDDAKRLMEDAARQMGWDYQVLQVIENVDVRELDQNHVVPNMGPPNFRGVWYPNFIWQ